jgi:glycosyltransferase involved in cell wall biosynthesis
MEQRMSTNGQPFVTVLTPVYNGGAYLADCIESILSQTYSNYEYIIVNNCSTDNTLEVANKYASHDHRIRVLTNERFVTVIENHNIAFRLVSPEAKYCKVVSGDDYIFPNCITRLVELAEQNPSVGLVGCYQLSGDLVRWQGFRYPQSVMSGRDLCRRFFLEPQLLLRGVPLQGLGSPTSLLYRADLVRKSPEFYPNLSPHADTSACLEILKNSDFGFVYEVLSYERTHSETQSSTSQDINRYLSQTLHDLQVYGSFYLSKAELETQMRETLKDYHRFLAVNYFFTSRDKKFWDYHKGRLTELGYPLTRLALFKAAVRAILEESVNPGQAIKKLQEFRSRSGRTKGGTGARSAGSGNLGGVLNNTGPVRSA